MKWLAGCIGHTGSGATPLLGHIVSSQTNEETILDGDALILELCGCWSLVKSDVSQCWTHTDGTMELEAQGETGMAG